MIFAEDNENLRKLTEEQTKEYDCLKKMTEEKMKDGQYYLESLKESVTEAQVRQCNNDVMV